MLLHFTSYNVTGSCFYNINLWYKCIILYKGYINGCFYINCEYSYYQGIINWSCTGCFKEYTNIVTKVLVTCGIIIIYE